MELHPEFKKLVDEHAKAAVEKYVKPEPWYAKLFWGVAASIIAAVLIAFATSIYSGGGDRDEASHQRNTAVAGVAGTEKKN